MKQSHLNTEVFYAFLKARDLFEIYLNELINDNKNISTKSIHEIHPFLRLRFFDHHNSLLGLGFWCDVELKWIARCQLEMITLERPRSVKYETN